MPAPAAGPLAAVRDGDEILIDTPGRRLETKLSPEEIAPRLAAWQPGPRPIPQGYMRRYVRLVGSAAKGAILG